MKEVQRGKNGGKREKERVEARKRRKKKFAQGRSLAKRKKERSE